jgi:hypothetical protein
MSHHPTAQVVNNTTQIDRGVYRRKVIWSSTIAFVLFFLGGTMSNHGWASDIAIKALGDAAFYTLSFGSSVAVIAAAAAGFLMLFKMRFIVTFSSAYSVTIIVIAAIILFGSFS